MALIVVAFGTCTANGSRFSSATPQQQQADGIGNRQTHGTQGRRGALLGGAIDPSPYDGVGTHLRFSQV